jgi:hypothetical protein
MELYVITEANISLAAAEVAQYPATEPYLKPFI